MRVPMKVDYGVRALVELALHYGEGPVQTAEIAYRQGIPEAYLEPTLWTVYFPIRAPNKRYGRRLRKPYKTFSATSA